MHIAFLGNFAVSHSSETHHAASLESLGHTVDRLQEGTATADLIADAATAADLFVWVHTHGWDTPGIDRALDHIKARGVPRLTYHLDLWIGLQRERDMRAGGPYWRLDYFFTADRCMAEWLSTHTPVQGHYLPAAVFGPECVPAKPQAPFDVAFIGSRRYHPEWPYRGRLLSWLRTNYRSRVRHYGNGGLDTVRGQALNQVLADARVVVGDSLCRGYDYPDYWSDRVYEVLGRGGFLIHPQVPGMEQHFTDGKHVVFYPFGDFRRLKHLIDYYLTHATEREEIRCAGHEYVRANHTYQHRWAYILEVLGR